MIFIKNFTESEGNAFKLALTQESGVSSLSITLPDEVTVSLLKSTVTGVYSSMKKSLEHVGKKVHNIAKDGHENDRRVTTQLLDKIPTEVFFYVKDRKIALVRNSDKEVGSLNDIDTGIEVNIVPEEDADKRFPRDIIAMIVPKRKDAGARLEYDPRNLVGKPIIVTDDDYQIILAVTKWPVWANLKFPVYLAITDSEGIIGAIQLSSKTENGVARNQIIDADTEAATNYLQESKKIMEEKMAAAKNNVQKQKDKGNSKFSGNQKNTRKGNINTKGYGGGGKNYNRNGQR